MLMHAEPRRLRASAFGRLADHEERRREAWRLPSLRRAHHVLAAQRLELLGVDELCQLRARSSAAQRRRGGALAAPARMAR